METSVINFGSVLNDTSKKIIMKMKNVSEMAVHYEWSFLEEDAQDIQNESEESKRQTNQNIPINEVFDILP